MDDDVNSLFGENKKMDHLIVIDNVQVLLTFLENLQLPLLFQENMGIIAFVFRIIATSQIWQKIISQSNIFNIFPSSIPQNSVVKILQSDCII